MQTQTKILILQHPREPDHELGTGKLAQAALEGSKLRVGLSWANLAKAWGEPNVFPATWGVLFLGSRDTKKKMAREERMRLLDRKGEPLDLSENRLTGIIVLDGSWSQAKALWWRNPWLLKLKRIALNPARPSLYRELRREPRRECLSTIEAIAETLDALGEDPKVGESLRASFSELLTRYRQQAHAAAQSPRNEAQISVLP
jgi:DTW domain-containing protein YfiP